MTCTEHQRRRHITLVSGAARRDTEAFEELYDEFADSVYAEATRILGPSSLREDAAQDAWLRIWRGAGSYDPDHGSVATWISVIARRSAIDLLRRARCRSREVLDCSRARGQVALVPSDVCVEDVVVARSVAAGVRAALPLLPSKEREIVTLAYFGDMSHSDVADRTGSPIGTVKTRMTRAHGRLRDLLIGAAAVSSPRRFESPQ